MTQITTINTDNYAAMAQIMGVSGATQQKAKSSTLPRLRIWNQGVKEKDGKRTVEIIPSGFFRLEVPDTAMYFAEKVTIRPFVQRFMYKKYDSAKNTYVKTVMHDNLNVDLKDTSGGFNCGKPAGYIQDFNALSDEMKDAIKQIKRVRVILGEVTMHGALDDKGNTVDVATSPFIYEVENKTAYKDMGEPFSQMARQKRLPLQHNINIETTEQELPTGASFFLPKPSLDLSTQLEITDEDHKTFSNFIEWIENYNTYVFGEWDNNKATMSTQEEDALVADLAPEVFVELEDDDDAA